MAQSRTKHDPTHNVGAAQYLITAGLERKAATDTDTIKSNYNYDIGSQKSMYLLIAREKDNHKLIHVGSSQSKHLLQARMMKGLGQYHR